MKNVKKNRGLGRGLDIFFTDALPDSVPVASTGSTGQSEGIVYCPIDCLSTGRYQPRTSMDPLALEELSVSIRAHGLIQPIVVRPLTEGRYEIIAGERRWRACQQAGFDTVPVIVKEVPDAVALPLAIIENIQREKLSAVDEARSIQRLLTEFGLTHQQISDSIGRSRTAVTNLLRLLSLHPHVLSLLNDACLDVGHARALLALPYDDQPVLARQVVDGGLSVRQTENLVRRHGKISSEKPVSEKTDVDARFLQERLADVLCAPVTLSRGAKGSVRLSIEYDCLDQVDDFLKRLGVFSD